MSKFNILICDDQGEHLESYKAEIKNSHELNEKVNEVEYSRGLTASLGLYNSVKEIVSEYKKYGDNIDIAIIDVDFSEIEGYEKDTNDKFGYKLLGLKISYYIQENFQIRPLDIIFVSANPGYIKETYGTLKTPRIHYIDKESNFEKIVVEKIDELLNNRMPLTKLIGNCEYIYELQGINENIKNSQPLELSLVNPCINNSDGSPITLSINLTNEPFLTFIGLMMSSCYDSENKEIEKKPKRVSSNDLANGIMDLNLFNDKSHIDKTLSITLKKKIFKNMTRTENPVCEFDAKKASSLYYGNDEECKNSCKEFIEKDKICCPMTFSYSKYKRSFNANINPDNISGKINKLKTELKKSINKSISEKLKKMPLYLESYSWNDGSKVASECKCSEQKDDQSCKFIICVYSLIYFDKIDNKSVYRMNMKPSIKSLKPFLME